MRYIADFFKNTGFDAVNRPSSPNLLYDEDQFPDKIEVRDVNLVQDGWIGKLRVRTNEVSVSDARMIDYVVIYDEDDEHEGGYEWLDRASCYTVRDFKELGGTIEFTLLYDAFCSMGGFEPGSGNTITGSANRITIPVSHYKSGGVEYPGYFHKNDSVEFFVLEEPFIPSDRLYTGFHDIPATPEVPTPPTPVDEVYNIARYMEGSAWYTMQDNSHYKFNQWVSLRQHDMDFGIDIYNNLVGNLTEFNVSPTNIISNISAQFNNHYVLNPDVYTESHKAQLAYLLNELSSGMSSAISDHNSFVSQPHTNRIRTQYHIYINDTGYYKELEILDGTIVLKYEIYGKTTYNGTWTPINKEIK